MRIVCYLNKLNDGGAERAMSVLANGLSRMGHRIILVTDYSMSNEYPLDPAVDRVILDGEFHGVTVKGRITRTIRRIWKLRNICKQNQADIMISFIEDANARALLATRGLDTKNLVSVRIDPKKMLRSRSKRMMVKFLYPYAEGIVFQTQDAKESMPENLRGRSRVIFNPVSDVFFETKGNALQDKRVVACGRLQGQKRFDLLINAFHQVCDDFPEYKLEIYGKGVYKSDLQAQIDQLGRQERIFLMGRSEDVPGTIKNASLFVMSSDYEGLPNALMEAITLGLPVISTDCGGGGARALIEDGVDGIIVPCDDVDALANAIRQSLADPEAAAARGKRAKEKAESFRAENIVALWEAYIRDIVEGN